MSETTSGAASEPRRCRNHPDVAGAACASCGAIVCERCTYGSLDGMVCAACYQKVRARRVRRGVIAGAAATILAGLGVAGIAMTSAHDSAPTAPAAAATAPPDAPSDLADAYREHLRQAPCNVEVASSLLDYLNQHGRWAELIADGDRLLGRCGTLYTKLRWRIEYAHKQLEQWIPAALIDAQLVAERPSDSDFWWWRGEEWAQAGLDDLALADDRQSIALSDDADAARFAVGRIGAPAGRSRACEGARAWRLFRRAFGGEAAQGGLDEEAKLSLTGHCQAEDGTGAATLALDDTGRGKAKVTIGKATGTFLVDPFTGTTIVTAAFAARAGVAPLPPHRPASAMAGMVVDGAAALAPEVAVGGSKAAQVDVIVADALPVDGIDGVLGLSYFWHFDVARDERSLVLSAPQP